MPSQERDTSEVRRPGSRSAKILSLVDVLATTGLLVMFFVFPVYSTAGDSYSSETGVTTHSTGSATLFESNPQAFSVLTGVVALALVALVLALITAWLGSPQARTALAVVLVPLSVLAVLGLFSIGAFMAPLVWLGWFVFARSATRDLLTLSADPDPWS